MFKRRRSADDFAEEIKAHLGLEADELKSEGLTEEEARRKSTGRVRQCARGARALLAEKPGGMARQSGARYEVCDSPAGEESRVLRSLRSLCWLSASARAWRFSALWMRLCCSRFRMRILAG